MRVQLAITCNRLKKTDAFSASDPYCILYFRDGDDWKEISRTEIVMDCSNPRFTIEHEFDENQELRIAVYDSDTIKDDFVGLLETTLPDIIAASPLTKELTEKNSKKPAGGCITIKVLKKE